MKMLWKKYSFKARLIICFVCISILPIFTLSVAIRSIYEKKVLQMVKEETSRSLELVNTNIDKQLEPYYNLAYFVGRDMQLRSLGETGYENAPDEEEMKNLKNLLFGYMTAVDKVQDITLLFRNGITFSTALDKLEEQRELTYPWYKKCLEDSQVNHLAIYSPGQIIYSPNKKYHTSTIGVSKAIENSKGEVIGAVNLLMFSQILKESMSDVFGKRGIHTYILDKNGNIVYSPILETTLKVKNSEEYVTVEKENEKLGWKIVGIISVNETNKQILALNTIMLICFCVCLIIVLLLATVLSTTMVKPIFVLRSLMMKAQKGNLSVRFIPIANDEINDLGMMFNEMLEKLEGTIEQVYKEQKLKRKAEMAALQANIKPHFLYNTLDTIHWMSLKYQADDITQTIEALSTLFRISLSKGSEIITIEQEIAHVASYLLIQRVRYEEMIEYEIHVTEECLTYKVQKLILQPLVENAIYHGIKESGRNGKIKIMGWKQEDSIIFVVEDDGLGMDEARLNKVRSALFDQAPSKDGVYGVANVHQRITLTYGNNYGLEFQSENEIGTYAIITYPWVE